MNKQEKQQEAQILLSWINHVLKTQLIQLIQLWNGEIFHKLLSLIPQITLRPYKPNPCNVWQLSFTNSKTIYRSIEMFWVKVLKKSWQSHSYIDLLKFSKQRNEEQIFELLVLVFGCCVQSQQKDRFIEPIYQFNQVENGQFMTLLQKYKFEDKLLDNKVIQIKDLMTKLEVLEIENDNLEKAMNDQLIELQLLQQSITYLSEENRKSKEQLKATVSSSSPMTDNYMDKSLVNSTTFGSLSHTIQQQQQNKAIIEQLKAKNHEDKQHHLKQVAQLKQTIQFLKDTIGGNRRERGVSSRRLSKGISQRIQTDHPPCVSLVKYQQVVFGQTEKVRQLTKSEAQKKQQIQKLQKELLNLKNIKQVPLIQKQQVDNYSGLKMSVLQGIKNNLEQYTRKKEQVLRVNYIQ